MLCLNFFVVVDFLSVQSDEPFASFLATVSLVEKCLVLANQYLKGTGHKEVES